MRDWSDEIYNNVISTYLDEGQYYNLIRDMY